MPCDPLRDLRAWQERLERLAAQRGSAWDPPMDVYETAARYVVTAEVPGLTREEIELAIQDGRLIIRGVRAAAGPEAAAHHYHQLERGHGSFQRTFEFLDAVDQNGITADLRNGVLTITLPKQASPPRRIEVQ
jgi:HSP20 family protein